MKLLKTFFFLFIYFSAEAQNQVVLLDTLNSNAFKSDLLDYYKNKFNDFNENLLDSSQKLKLSKSIYLEHQKEFLEKIYSNNFISDKELNNYVQNLVKDILEKNKLNKDNYKVLISKDSEINAYNTGDGTIVINYGLFTVIENENELVFVLCHEIGHQELQHVKKEVITFINNYTSEEVIDKTKEIKKLKFRKASAANTLLLKLNYKNYFLRRKKEIEADSMGVDFYKKTNRSLNSVLSLLEKLNNSNKEQDSISVFDYKEVFETDFYKLKKRYFEEATSIFNSYDYKPIYEIDSLKTHPDCITRMNKIEKIISNKNTLNDSSDIFLQIKKNAIQQNLYNLFLDKAYGLSLYETLKLFLKNKNNSFYKQLICLNLIEIQKSKINLTLSKYIPQQDRLYNTKSLNRFINLINELKVNELEIIIEKFR
ncbi:M48 family metallopeptidase [Flavobacterium sp.]|uniref:M48 family metallopeptidase n=1 Tax=Flavobacterium sp. TaxID=239 RepID=UPI002608037B|nr:M48 family metallopeptidase [Flavobacterium sp.]